MRTREDIEKVAKEDVWGLSMIDKLKLEVLLDIRELLMKEKKK